MKHFTCTAIFTMHTRDLLDSVNSTLKPYAFQNLSNASVLEIILHGDERLSLDSNSEILKATLRYITQHNVLNKAMLVKLRCCNSQDLGVFFGFLFFFYPFILICSFYVKWPQGRHSLVLLVVSFR